MSDVRTAPGRGDYGKSAGLLTVALGLAGVLMYAFFAITSHTLSADDYGEIVILWSAVFLLASTMFRPVEQLLASSVAEHEQTGTPAGETMRSAALIQAGLMTAIAVAILLARDPIQDELLGGSSTLYWVMLASVAGFGLAYYARGLLAGRGQFFHYAALLLIEVGTRVAFAVALAVGIADGVDFVALGIATAPVASVVVLPLAFAARRRSTAPAPPTGVPGGSAELTLGRGGAFVGAVLVMMLGEQILINSGALFVRAAEGAAAAGFIFNVMMVARAPLVLFQAVVASLLPHLTRLRAHGDSEAVAAFRSSVAATIKTVAAFAAATFVGVLAIGPPVMEIAFGSDHAFDRLGLAIVAVGMGFYLTAASLNLAALAQAQAHRAAVCWIAATALFVVFNISGALDPVRAVEVGFTASAALLAGLLYLLYRNPSPSPDEAIEPDSIRELQTTLAAGDEVA